jgi:hypothetical protein
MGDLFGSLYQRRAGRELVRIRKTFGLNRTEAARLFRVSPQAFGKWELRGVPTARLADVFRCSDLAQQLARTLRPERLPALVRNSAPDLGDRSVLQVIRDEGTQPIVDYMYRLASGLPR